MITTIDEALSYANERGTHYFSYCEQRKIKIHPELKQLLEQHPEIICKEPRKVTDLIEYLNAYEAIGVTDAIGPGHFSHFRDTYAYKTGENDAGFIAEMNAAKTKYDHIHAPEVPAALGGLPGAM